MKMGESLEHVGVLGMHWGHRKSLGNSNSGNRSKRETNLQQLTREANPKPWSLKKKILVGVGLGAGIVLPPIWLGLTVAAGSSIYFSHKAATQKRAQEALDKLKKKKLKSLPSSRERLRKKAEKMLETGGLKGKNDSAITEMMKEY
jgi:hypothetical protein